ncbi:DNA-binding response regulator [Leucobacter zeae]|nr:DNA-binding response regulator [Leucobacter zeae]
MNGQQTSGGQPGPADRARGGPIRIVIVDDHQIFRTGLRAELGAEVETVGEAASVDEAVEAIAALGPDVVLLDVHLPGGNGGGGAEVVRRLATVPEARGTRFLALSVSDAADDVVSVIRAGARGYLTKAASGAEVTAAVTRVHGGDAVFSPRLAGFVLDAFGAGGGETAAADDELDRLSAREQEVMRMIARGYAYKEVAAELFLSVKTVESHVSSVLRKLQLSNRHELTAWALQRRLL